MKRSSELSSPEQERRLGVLFVMIDMAMGGSERLIFNLVSHLDRRVFRPSVAWLTEAPPLSEFEALGVPLHCIPKRQRRIDFVTMRQLATLIRTEGIDLVNAHHTMPFLYAYGATKLANRARLVYTEHSEADVLAAKGYFRKKIGGGLLRRSDAAIGVSPFVSQTICSHFSVDPEKVHTIENGVDLDMFAQDERRREALRAEFGFSPHDVVIGTVANFRRNKNHLFLLRAFQQAARGRADVKLVLIGQGFPGDPENSEPDVVRFIESAGLGHSVRLLGYRSNVHDLMRMLDVFCLVSYKEGLPLSLIEAMASGLPVVGTDIEGIRGVIEPQTNGLLAPCDDVPKLADALHRMIAQPAVRHSMGQASRRIASERYSLERCVKDTQDLFVSLVRDGAVPIRARQAGARPADEATMGRELKPRPRSEA